MAKERRTDTIRFARSEVVKNARAASASYRNEDEDGLKANMSALDASLTLLDDRSAKSKAKGEAVEA